MENNTTTVDQQNIQNQAAEQKNIKLHIQNLSKKVSDKIKNGKYLIPILWILAAVTTIWMWLMIVKTVLDVQNLNSRSEELYNIKDYNTAVLTSNNYTKNEVGNFKKINELISYNLTLKETANKYEEYLQDIQAPYENFLKYIFLPSLNIWKDPFVWDIQDDLFWVKYLESNPYNDIDLIDKRSNFIKDVWTNNEYNEINSIEVWEINEVGDDFYIPIKVSYTSNSYRSFLLLVEKLSITSNQKSISLINELIYNIRWLIKSDNASQVADLQERYPDFSQDKAIWYDLYQRVMLDSHETSLINDTIIDKAIKQVAQCWNESVEYCYYKFRNKYRNLPSLAYSIWLESNWEKTENLRNFLKDLPQIIKIVNFTYDGEEKTDMTNYSTKQYKWRIEFRIYWDGLYEDEVVEIQKLLWNKCLWKDLTPESALEQIEWKLVNLWNNTNIDTYSTIRLMELQNLIWNIWKTFESLSNYKKVIKTFEMYRMLNEWNICNI